MDSTQNTGNHFNDLLDHLPEAILIIDQAGKIEFANQSAARLTGLSTEELQNRKIKLPENFTDAFEYNFQLPGNKPLTAQISLSEINWNNKKAYLSFLHDITQQKTSLEALANSKEIFWQVSQAAREAICMADEMGEILFFNHAAEELFEVLAEDVIGTDISFIIPQDFRKLFEKNIKTNHQILQKSTKTLVINQSGQKIPVEFSLISFDIGNRPIYLVNLLDISEKELLSSDFSALKSKFHLLETESTELQSINRAGETRIETLHHENTRLTEISQTLQSTVDELHQQLNHLQNQYSQLQMQRDDIDADFVRSQKQNLQLADQVKTLETRLKQTEKENSQYLRSLKSSEGEIKTLQKNLLQLQTRLSKAEDQLDDANQETKQQVKHLAAVTKELESVRKNFDRMSAKNAQYLDKIEQLSTDRKQYLKSINDLTDKNRIHKTDIQQLQENRVALEAQLSSLLIERDKLFDNVTSLASEQASIQEELEKTGEERDSLNRELLDATATLSNIREEHQRYQNILENSTNSMMLIDRQGKIVWCNHAAYKLKNLDRQKIIGENIRFLSDTLLSSQIGAKFWDDFFSNHPIQKQSFDSHSDGTPEGGWLHIDIQPVPGLKSEKPFFLINTRDITKQKNLEIRYALCSSCSTAILNYYKELKTIQPSIFSEVQNKTLDFEQDTSEAFLSDLAYENIKHSARSMMKSFLENAASINDIMGGGLYQYQTKTGQFHAIQELKLPQQHAIAELLDEIKRTDENFITVPSGIRYLSTSSFVTPVFPEQPEIVNCICQPVFSKIENAWFVFFFISEYIEIPDMLKASLDAMSSQICNTLNWSAGWMETQRIMKNADTVLQNQAEIMFVVDTDGKILQTNQQTYVSLGYSEDELHQTDVACLLPEEQLSLLSFNGNKKHERNGELHLLTKSGEKVPYRYAIHESNWNGKHAYFINCMDIRQEVTIRNEVKQLNEIQKAVKHSTEKLLSGSNWQADIWFVFKKISEILCANRIYLYQVQDENDSSLWSIIQEWTDGRVEMRSKLNHQYNIQIPQQDMAVLEHPQSESLIIQGNSVTFPSEIWKYLAAPFTNYMVYVPVYATSHRWGYIGLDFLQDDVSISQEKLDTLVSIAGLVGNTIQKQNALHELNDFKNQMEDEITQRTSTLQTACNELTAELNLVYKTEESQEKTISHYMSLFNSMTHAYIIIDEELIVRDFNSSAKAFLKNIYNVEIAAQQYFFNYVSENDQPYFQKQIHLALQKEPAQEHTKENYQITGKYGQRHYEVEIQSLISKNQQAEAAVIIIEDITDHQQAKAESEQEKYHMMQQISEQAAEISFINAEILRASHTVDRFLSSIRHELRMPLNQILNNSETLLEEVHGPITPRQQQALTKITEQGHSLQDFINDILVLAMVESGKMELELSHINIQPVCQEYFQLFKELAKTKKIKTSLSIDSSLPEIDIDEKIVKQILHQLLDNALKYTPEQGNIGLDVIFNQDEASVSFTVWDDGIGIETERYPLIFKPFTQSKKNSSPSEHGLGLGLALVYRLVEIHEGGIVLESEIGKGSRFCITLPCDLLSPDPCSGSHSFGEEEQVLSSSSATDNTKSPQHTILLADHHEHSLSIHSDCLMRQGYRVLISRSLHDTMDMLRQFEPWLIIMSLELEEIPGIEAIHRIRHQDNAQNTPIIALTSLSFPGDALKTLEAGASHYCPKPVHPKKLLEMVLSFEQLDENNKEVTGVKKQDIDRR